MGRTERGNWTRGSTPIATFMSPPEIKVPHSLAGLAHMFDMRASHTLHSLDRPIKPPTFANYVDRSLNNLVAHYCRMPRPDNWLRLLPNPASLAFFAVFAVHFLLICAKINDAGNRALRPSEQFHSSELVLNPEKLDMLLHSAAIHSLLSAKARSLLTQPRLPAAEALLYSRCAADAQTASRLAKCVVPLLRARDAVQQQERGSVEEGSGGEMDWMGWPNRLGSWLLQSLAKGRVWLFGSKVEKYEEKNLQKAKKRKKLPRIWPTVNGHLSYPEATDDIGRKRRRLRKPREAKMEVNPVKLFQNMFRMNSRQLERARMARARRNGEQVARQPIDFVSGKNVPWYLRPLGQLIQMAKRMLSGKRGSVKRDKRKRKGEESGGHNKRAKRGTELKNIEKLGRIQHFFEMAEHCNAHLARTGAANSEFLSKYFSSQTPSPAAVQSVLFGSEPSQFDRLAEELQQMLSNYSFHSFPILSPRLLSLFPEQAQSNEPNLLSPTLFSFHNEGMFALPTLLGLVSSSEGEMLELLDLFMELAGASCVLNKLLAEIEPRREHIERRVYPMVMRLERMERRWARVERSLSEQQRARMASEGYALLDRRQQKRLYGRSTEDRAVTDELALESDIYRMAELDAEEDRGASDRLRRDTTVSTSELLFHRQSRDSNASDQIRSVRPFLFTNNLRDTPVAVNGAVLSPRAFFQTLSSPNFMRINVLSPVAFAPAIMSPTAMALSVLSPTAFTANILTPNTLWTEVMSPKFFHSNILSPRALATLIMSPRTMLGEVLSPKLVEARVLNPGTFFIGILGPNILMPRVLSPNNFGITVLSPNILSPSMLSKGNFTVQVLSPAIMSDDVTGEQFWRGEWQKETRNTTHLD